MMEVTRGIPILGELLAATLIFSPFAQRLPLDWGCPESQFDFGKMKIRKFDALVLRTQASISPNSWRVAGMLSMIGISTCADTYPKKILLAAAWNG